MNRNKRLEKIFKKKNLLIGITALCFVLLSTACTPTEKTSKEQQQKDFLKIYEDIIDNIYTSRTTFYFSNNLLTVAPKDTLYNLFKESENFHKECSLYYFAFSPPLPDSLKEFEKDFEQSFSELASSYAILQDYSEYMADFINTNNLESSRKAEEALEREPFEMMSNAVSRLVFGVGRKIGVDAKALSKEYQEISNKVIQEFKDEFGGGN